MILGTSGHVPYHNTTVFKVDHKIQACKCSGKIDLGYLFFLGGGGGRVGGSLVELTILFFVNLLCPIILKGLN